MSTNRTNDFESPIPISQGGTGATTAAQARIDLGITIGARTIEGTTDQIQVVNGDGAGGNPVISIKSDPIIPGSGSMTVPIGTNVSYPAVPSLGMIRGNSDTNQVEIYSNGAWSGYAPFVDLIGPITSVGNLTSIASQTGTGTTFVVDDSPTLITPNLGTPSAAVLTNATGTASGLTAGNVTTNANLTGPITSIGNATSVASQTGTGSTFVMNTSPSLVTPSIGVATATSVNKVALTAPATSATLTIANGKTLTQSNSLTYTGTDGSSVAFGTGGTVAYVPNVFKTINTQVFTSSGTYTPTPGMLYCVVELVGGGGGGGGIAGVAAQTATASGGGAGGYSRRAISAATIGVSQSATVGNLGAGGAAGNNPGATGGTSQLGALVSATGGAGGIGGASSAVSVASGAAGPGGTGSLGDLNTFGSSGFRGYKVLTTSANSGDGGSSFFGGGGRSLTGPAAGNPGTNYGSGGAGAAGLGATSFAGGAGSPGVIVITEYM